MGLVAVVLYAVLAGITIWRHEPWADEAQSWLLARDAGLFDLWTRLMRYEGSPGLWQTLLHILIRGGLPYAAIGVVSGALAVAGAWLAATRAPWPVPIRLLLPFTFFLGYQYAVVARSYALLPPLLFAAALLYVRGRVRFEMLTAVLCLIAAVSVHGFALSLAIWIPAGWMQRRKNIAGIAAAYAVAMTLIALSAWPAPHGTFIDGFDARPRHFLETGVAMLAGAFTGEPWTSAAVVGLSMPLLWRGRTLPMFVISAASVCGIGALVYAQVWHHGMLWLAWLFAMWTAAAERRMGRWAVGAMTLAVVPQVVQAAATARYDWSHPYSGAAAAARSIAGRGLADGRIHAVGYACTAVQPYFGRNIFGNVNGGRPEAYWDWSASNHVNEDSARLDVLRPAWVLIGYKNDFERKVWTDRVVAAGYSPMAHFEGASFWKMRVFEPESYDLYRRSAAR